MSPYETALAEIERLKARVKDLEQQVATGHAGLLAGIKLERDMFEQRYEMKNRACNVLMAERMHLVAENRSLQDDRMMLDWLDENHHYTEVDFPPGAHLKTSGWTFYAPKDAGTTNTARNRLRAAMEEFSKPLVGGLFGNLQQEEED